VKALREDRLLTLAKLRAAITAALRAEREGVIEECAREAAKHCSCLFATVHQAEYMDHWPTCPTFAIRALKGDA
jgi:hypothetical protein